MIIFGAIELVTGLTGMGGNIAHFAHLGGMIFGVLLLVLWHHDDLHKHNQAYFQDYRDRRDSRDSGQRWNPFSKREKSGATKYYVSQESGRPISDEDFNARKQAEKQRIDEILDKISKKGYDALSKEEKDILFRYSQK